MLMGRLYWAKSSTVNFDWFGAQTPKKRDEKSGKSWRIKGSLVVEASNLWLQRRRRGVQALASQAFHGVHVGLRAQDHPPSSPRRRRGHRLLHSPRRKGSVFSSGSVLVSLFDRSFGLSYCLLLYISWVFELWFLCCVGLCEFPIGLFCLILLFVTFVRGFWVGCVFFFSLFDCTNGSFFFFWTLGLDMLGFQSITGIFSFVISLLELVCNLSLDLCAWCTFSTGQFLIVTAK